MEVLHPLCAGLDVHKDIIVACRRHAKGNTVRQDVESFEATTRGLLELAAWIGEWEITEVVMESTGVYWIPVWNVLEEQGFKLTLVNPQHVKNVPGRKSDVKDAEWLAKLLAHGMVRASFIPPAPQRELRNLVRTLRSFIEDRTQQMQRMQKILQGCNIKLDSVLSDITGETGLALLEAIIAGESDPDKLAALATRRIKASRKELSEALHGRANEHSRFLLQLHLDTYKDMQAKIERLEAEINRALRAHPPFADALVLLATIPGVGPGVARTILAEVGADMSRFPTAGHLVSWAGLCPRLDENAGKVRSRKVRPGNRHLKTVLCQSVLGNLRCKKKYLQALYHRTSRGSCAAKRRALKRAERRSAPSVAYRLREGDLLLASGWDGWPARWPGTGRGSGRVRAISPTSGRSGVRECMGRCGITQRCRGRGARPDREGPAAPRAAR